MILYINAAEAGIVELALISPTSVHTHTLTLPHYESHKLLKNVRTFLKKNNHTSVNHLVVCTGPGSFTGIRVTVSMAQGFALGWGCRVSFIPLSKVPQDLLKLNTQKFSQELDIDYNKAPF